MSDDTIEISVQLFNKLVGIGNAMATNIREYSMHADAKIDCELCEKLYGEERKEQRGIFYHSASLSMNWEMVIREVSKAVTEEII